VLRRRHSWAAGLLLLVASASRAGVMPEARHFPPTSVIRGEGVPLSVVAPDSAQGVPTVAVHYRLEGSGSFSAVRLAPGDGGVHSGYIPADATRGLAVKYYIEITESSGAQRALVGSASQPLSVRVNRAHTSSSTWVYGVPALGLALLLLQVGVHLGRRKRRKSWCAELERGFWTGLLQPLTELRGHILSESIAQIAGIEHCHPVRGWVLLDADEIRQRLCELRQTHSKHSDRGEQPDSTGRAAEELEGRLRVLAADVRRIRAAAWFLSTLEPTEARRELDSIPLLRIAERNVKITRQALEGNRIEPACSSLNELIDQHRRLRQLVADADGECAADDIERSLLETAGVTDEMLVNLLEYYAVVSTPSPESRKKLSSIAAVLANRDSLSSDPSAKVRAALEQAKIAAFDTPIRDPGQSVDGQLEVADREAMDDLDTDAAILLREIERELRSSGAKGTHDSVESFLDDVDRRRVEAPCDAD
jgi:hypothetical protein